MLKVRVDERGLAFLEASAGGCAGPSGAPAFKAAERKGVRTLFPV